MKMRQRKWISLTILIALLLTTLFSLQPARESHASWIGEFGSLPSGGVDGDDGGICAHTTIFRVGIYRETLTTGTITQEVTNDEVTALVRDHFATHFPRINEWIMFVPSTCYTQDAIIGEYEASNGKLFVRDRDKDPSFHDAKVRLLQPTNTNPANDGLFYNRLSQAAPNPEQMLQLSVVTGRARWQEIVQSVDPNGAKSRSIWNYLLGNENAITSRLQAYYCEPCMEKGSSPEDLHKGRLKYLDLLLTVYALLPEQDRESYGQHIEDFITGNGVEEKPVLFAVDTAVRFSSKKYIPDKFLYMSSTDFVQWMHAANKLSSLTDPEFKAPPEYEFNTFKLIEHSAKEAMRLVPDWDRYTDRSVKSSGFNHGYSGVLGRWLETNTKTQTAIWKISENVKKGVMESLVFHDEMIGFVIAGAASNKRVVDCTCAQNVVIPNKKLIEGELETNYINNQTELTIQLKETDDQMLENWKEKLDGATDLQMYVRLWRSQAPGQAKWSTGNSPQFTDDASPGKVWANVSREQLLSYLANGVVLHYTDDLLDYRVEDGEMITFRYNASVAIRGIDRYGNEFEYNCKQNPSTEFVVYRPKNPETAQYMSVPSFWSEIKQGYPGNEQFEAMAGTPTTRNLYFATGGSEFIVDIEVEYVEDATSTRTYRSHFTGGVPSEFKEGDQAKDYRVTEPSGATSSSLVVNGHLGGQVSATWKGDMPFIGKIEWGKYYATEDNRWDESKYEAALAQANAWVSALNSFTVEHTAASDGITRKFNNWGASITVNDTNKPAGKAHKGAPEKPCTDEECTNGVPEDPPWGIPAKDGTYTITVTGTMPAKIIDGPSSTYDLPALQDTWTQTITYDYMKINKAKVWKIDRSKLDGMLALTDTDEFTASIVQGDPTVFYNIANPDRLDKHASEEGRLRYSLETDWHDVVVWNEGPRTNKDDGRGDNGLIQGPGQGAAWATGAIYTNATFSDEPNYHAANSTAKDKQTFEYKRFDERRKSLTEVTAISDFLILQTSGGDQSVLYFEQTSAPTEAQNQVDIPKTSFEMQWLNNPLSAANWSQDEIHIGSYNGKYTTPDDKYSKANVLGHVETVFDRLPAGMVRPARPAQPLLLVNSHIDIIDTYPNGLYRTGEATVFYELLIDTPGGNAGYATSFNSRYGGRGAEFATTYSPLHGKINDVVIHNPVSVQEAMVVSLPAERDQRTDQSKQLGGNLQKPTVDYEKRLKPGYQFTPTPPTYEEREVPNPGYVPPQPGVSQTFSYTGSAAQFVAPRDGTYTLEVWGASGGSANQVLYEWYNPVHNVTLHYRNPTGHDWEYCVNHPSHPTGKVINYGAGPGGLGGYASGKVELQAGEVLHVYVGGQGQDGSWNTGTASGGWNGGGNGWYYSGGGGGATDIRAGGTSLNNRIIVAGGGGGAQRVYDTSYIAPGGHGGGMNGGEGHTHGYFGFGYASRGGSQNSGGANVGALRYLWYNEYHNVHLWYPSSTGYENVYCGSHHPSHFTGVVEELPGYGNNGSLGYGGHAASNYQGGGGGGYYGGASGAYNGYSGAGGSGYIGKVAGGTMQSGVHAGNGKAIITAPDIPAVGTPAIIMPVMVDPGMMEPPDDAYEFVEIVHDPGAPIVTPAGTYEPGNFINLDYAFTIKLPNRGDFYGNGAHGLSMPSTIPGKGFVNGMDTTEWTVAKQVRFAFIVMYNGTLYAPGTWIDLDVHQEDFEFYLPLANSEAISATVEFRALANNHRFYDADTVLNKNRFHNFSAKHSARKAYDIDIVGRIGAFAIEDTTDFRFSNLLKEPVVPTEWLVPNVVKKVNPNRQHGVIGDEINIRGEHVSTAANYLDTYGLLPHLRQPPIPLPLSPERNNIDALNRQPLRLGYDVFADIQTIGNYYNRMQIIPYYYALNLNDGEIYPVDIYMDVEGRKEVINKFGAAVPGWDPATIYPYVYALNWNEEAGRRNYSEVSMTDQVVQDSVELDEDGNETSLGKPFGSHYPFGTAQIMMLDHRNRTFIGSEHSDGTNRNPNMAIDPLVFGKQAQRWHFTYGLPSSATAVRHGLPPTESNVAATKNSSTVLLLALDIKAMGDTYVLQYDRPNADLTLAGRTWPLSSIPYPVVTVFSADRSSADDLTISGTH